MAIPVLIHLFNLRRYKTVYFPHTRFLQNIQLHSRRQSQVRYKWLLAARLLFLLFLILAFAQPFFNTGNKAADTNRLQVIYVDNSGSMSAKKGALRLLDIARDAARKQVQKAPQGSRFILLSNDKPFSYRPSPADKVLAELNNLDISPATKTSAQVLSMLQGIMRNETNTGADLYYYSDFQKASFSVPDTALRQNISFYGVPVRAEGLSNIYIDTAYLDMPVLQTGENNRLLVRTRAAGKLPEDMPVLQLSVNGQVKSAATLDFSKGAERTDTLEFRVNEPTWQNISLTVNDAAMRFDDTFRIAARSAPGLSVLVLNEGQSNPYIQAAFRAYNGFRINQTNIGSAEDWKNYNLVILNDITRIDAATGQKLADAMEQGQTVCIFPGITPNFAALNEGLQLAGDIRISGLDTAVQTVSNLQEGSVLVKDLFERIPDNVQLPTVNRHYIIESGLSANQQAVMSFRNGDPFLARYTPSRGQLYLCAAPADLQSGNFAGSYFFVPFLYRMAIQSGGGAVYALTAGRRQAAFLPMTGGGDRNMVHLYGNGLDAIPPQRPNGSGLDVFADAAVSQPGFYTLAAAGADTTSVALNADRTESQTDVWDMAELKTAAKGTGITWLDATEAAAGGSRAGFAGFPLWKVCVILALLMLGAETALLAGNFRKQTAATQ